jgi:hypothetical protein
MTQALNLADLFLRYKFLKISAEEFISRHLAEKTYKRVYVGSYFCQNYFCGGAREIITELVKRGLKITLVVPVFWDLESGWKEVSELITYADEICVNDYGALERAKNLGRKIILGRLFFKKTRDPRYPELQNLSSSLNSAARRLVEDYKISSVEVEGVKNFSAPANLEIAAHFPLAYITYGICLYASISLPAEKKFRSGGSCNFQCSQSKIFYPEGNFTRIGKAIFFDAPKFENPARLLIWPNLEVGR